MSVAVKTIVATGLSSGIGFEVLSQLLQRPNPSKLILGVRNPIQTNSKIQDLKYDTSKHSISLHQVDFADLTQVKNFALGVKNDLPNSGEGKGIDWLLMNHGCIKGSRPYKEGDKWCEDYVVNALSQHYLVHLLRPDIEAGHGRVVFVSSGAISMMPTHPSKLESILLAKSDKGEPGAAFGLYAANKFTQLLNVQYWRRQLSGKAEVLCVSPGLIPGTGLGRYWADAPDMSRDPSAKDIPTGARSTLAAFEVNPLPEDTNKVFFTSWGEWWDPKEKYPLSLDHKLQDEWSPSQADIEREAGIV